MKDERPPTGEPAGAASHRFAQDGESQPTNGDIEIPTQAVEETVATPGCHVPLEEIRKRLADRGQPIEAALIEKAARELKRQSAGSGASA
jgi:hypothetical protein